jgi:ribonuclease D
MAEEEFALLEQRGWTGKSFDPDSCMRIKGANGLDDDNRRVLRAVVSLRDSIAKRKNRPPFKVWGNDICMKLAQTKPTKPGDLRKALGENNHVIRRYGRDVLAAVQAGCDDTTDAPQPPKPPQRINPLIPPFSRDDEPLLSALKNWRNSRSKAEKLGPGMIVNNALLKDLAALKPKSTQQLELITDMRTWQRKEYGAPLVDFIVGWLEKHPEDAEPRERRPGRRRGRRGGRRSKAEAGEAS